MNPFIRAIREMVESSWVTSGMWKQIIEKADKDTLLFLRDEAMTDWKVFRRKDWMSSETLNELKKLVDERLKTLHESELLQKFFDGITEIL